MQESQLVSAVRQSTTLPDNDSARTAVRATLAVLGQRVAGGESRDLAAQLPDPLAEVLPGTGGGERFGVDEFYGRVARLEGDRCTAVQARQHARAVASALRAAITAGELADVRAQLPAEYDDLFGTGPVLHH